MSDVSNSSASENDDSTPRRPQTWRERHALKLLGLLMIACFATVIVAQTAC